MNLGFPVSCLFLFFIGPFPSAILERSEVRHLELTGGSVGLLVGFSVCLFLLYSLVPLLLQISGATMLNLSLLTSDVYSLLFGLFLFHYKFSGLYILAFCTIIVGLIIYYRARTPVHFSSFEVSERETSTIQPPATVNNRSTASEENFNIQTKI
eukprot:m.57013 g.57013  ORF g.57013 m.57013 type:complete len:154 (+) comp18830_c1_seq1:203-664(+)